MTRDLFRDRPPVDDIASWRSAAKSALVVAAFLLGGYLMTGHRPLPLREELVRIDGTVVKMAIHRFEDGCRRLSIRIETAQGRIRAENMELCDALAGFTPLQPGTPITVLAEPAAEWYVPWEMRSGDRLLIPYESMHAARENRRRAWRLARPLIVVLCVPCFAVLALWLLQEFLRLIGRDRGDDERWDSGAGWG